MNTLTLYLPVFILLPLAGLVVSLLVSPFREKALSRVAFLTAGVQHLLSLGFVGWWIATGADDLNIKEMVLYRTSGYEFFIDLYFDRITAVYLIIGSLLTFLVTVYSRTYLHREPGYKRFFNSVLLFYTGFNLTILAGNFETLFIGWEILGISSFLLIAFYRERYLPVRNAFKVFSLYRLGDICMILAMWMSHHLWHHNVTFAELNNAPLVASGLEGHFSMGLFISLMILIAAAVKSAQLPFSSWLPRAMEGPTPSSAIFYGSLYVHIGVFILLRTAPFWEHQMLFRVLMGGLGVATAGVATWASRVQSTVKSQIAYSSVAQIGLIFLEVALGLEVLALVHLTGNAFLRTYQLLVSPSVVTYLIRQQQYGVSRNVEMPKPAWLRRLRSTLYVLSVKEWNLDTYTFRYLWKPFKAVGSRLEWISPLAVWLVFVPVFGVAALMMWLGTHLDFTSYHLMPGFFGAIGLLLAVRAFVERERPLFSWGLAVFTHFWLALAVSFNEHFHFSHTWIYLAGVVVAGAVGWFILVRMQQLERISLQRFQGHVYEHRWLAFGFLLACLALAGFPITSTFIGEDLLYSHIHADQWLLALWVSLAFVLEGLIVIRIYARVFLGPHVKTYHPVAYRAA